MGKLAEITWPQEYSELQRIEELLLCGICYEYMDTSVMTPCSHNYCSLCIRKYLHYKTQCPACFEKTFEKDLHTNRILDEIVTYFSKIREKLASCVAGAKIVAAREDANEEDSVKSTPVRPARTNQSLKKLSPKVEIERTRVVENSPKVEIERTRVVENSPKVEKVQTFVTEQQKIVSSPSTSSVCKIATIFTPRSKKNVANVVTSGKSVPCPVCAVEVSESHINRHLDDCLKRETTAQQVTRIEPKRKPLPKLVFSLMKDAELRKKMKDLGLPSQGDRKTLETRFHRYSTLYNAECDKKEPRTIEELLKQCENEENLEKKMLKFSQAANRLKITRNCEQNAIEEAQKKYLDTNRQNYSELIASIKDRENKKRPVRRSLIPDPAEKDRGAEPELAIFESNENLETSTEIEDDPLYYSIHAYEATFHDSDSESSCVLQHYTSDDPVKFHSFEMSAPENSPEKTEAKQTSSRNLEEKEDESAENSKSDTKEKSTEGIWRLADVYSATTDAETSDDDYVPPSPNTTISRTTKRAKFSLNMNHTETNDSNRSNDSQQDHLVGHQLAMSIAQDFTFDSSSNESLPSPNVNESEPKIDKLKNLVTENGDIDKEEKLKDGKENESLTESSCEKLVNRPLRKRKCLRFPNVDNVENPRLNENKTIVKAKTATTTTITQEESEKVNQEEDNLSRPFRVDSPLKRRRGRKATPKETEPIDPPRRPLRKRLVNATTTATTKK